LSRPCRPVVQLSSAVGRAFFVYLPDTLTAPVLRAHLETAGQDTPPQEGVARIKSDVLRDGVAVTSGGVIPGVASLAAPVFTAGESLPLGCRPGRALP
jgi:DNA-binding IclR family transcriptional regulator